jgi:hypothetical protein
LAVLISPHGDFVKSNEEPPPILGSWNRLYALVLGTLALAILLLGLFARSFR